jgi:hypothetical protein
MGRGRKRVEYEIIHIEKEKTPEEHARLDYEVGRLKYKILMAHNGVVPFGGEIIDPKDFDFTGKKYRKNIEAQ